MKTIKNLNYRWLLYIRGLILFTSAILLITPINNNVENTLFLFSILTFIVGCLGLWFYSKNSIKEQSRGWLLIESIADIIFTIIAFNAYFLSDNFTNIFIALFIYFSIFLFFQKISNIFRIAQVGIKNNTKILIIRLIIATGFGISGFLIVSQPNNFALHQILIFMSIGVAIEGVLLTLFGDKMYLIKNKYKY